MAYYLKPVINRRGDTILPKTVATGVFMVDKETVEVRINQLLKESQDRLKQIQTLDTKVNNNKKEIDKSISDIRSSIKSQNSFFEKEITEIKDTVISNKTALEKKITNLTTTVNNNKTDIEKKVTNLTTTVNNNKKTTDTTINNLSTTVTNNKKDADKKITEVKTSITNINKSITNVTNTVTGQAPKLVFVTFPASGWVTSTHSAYKFMQSVTNNNFTSSMVSPVASLNVSGASSLDSLKSLATNGGKIVRMVTYNKGVTAYTADEKAPEVNLTYIFRV